MLSALLLCGEDATVRTVTRVFKDLGVDVDACVDQKNAIRKMTAKKFDAIVADDEIHGATHTLEAALDLPLCRKSVRIILAGEPDSVGLAFQRGTQIVLYKPLSPERVRHGLRAVRNLMAYADIPFETAIVNATRSPARLLQLERELGTLEAGKRADLSIWSDEYAVLSTIVGGVPVHGTAHLYRPSRTANA